MSTPLVRHLLRTALVVSCGVACNAFAQLRLPATPSLPTAQMPLPTLERTLATANTTIAELDSHAQKNLRALQIRELLHRHSDIIEADPNGAPMLRQQIIAISASTDALTQIQSLGFKIIATRKLADLDIDMVTLAVPAQLSTANALQHLRALDPNGQYDFNHVYLRSGQIDSANAATNPAIDATHSNPATLNPARLNSVGLIDSGIAREHSAFRHNDIRTWGCADRSIPTAHGTAVASLMVGDDANFHGAAPTAPLYAADIYCGEPSGGDVATIAAACGWLAQQRVPVINISLVGPPNLLLERVVKNMQQRGHLIVAAVGNDGPAAAPLYPAAYLGVIGVTAVDSRDRVLIEAGRGQQVAFAAPGADMIAATLPNTYVKVRGTSFAAPIVAGLLARSIGVPDRDAAAAALMQLRDHAIDLGAHGRDDIYGDGLVGKEIRITSRNEK